MAGTFTNLLYHIIFSTKERRPYIKPEFEEELYKYIAGIIRGEGGSALIINGVDDHLHLLVKLKPYPSISDMLQKIKGHSSRWINEQQKLAGKFHWQDGYAAFTVSESAAPDVKEYIANQKEHHRKLDYKTELILFLKKHNVEYDERYIWDRGFRLIIPSPLRGLRNPFANTFRGRCPRLHDIVPSGQRTRHFGT